MPLKVASVQLGLYRRNPEKAMTEAESEVKVAASKGARLVCLPEHWLLTKVLRPGDPALRKFQILAKDLDIYLNLGANFLRRGGSTYLSSHTISPKGDLVSVQDKLHLYRREKKLASPGRIQRTFEVDGFKIGVMVCHDLVFPEPARTLTLMGANLLVVPALIEADGRLPWIAYLKARTLENRVPIVSPNCYSAPNFLGPAAVMGLQYSNKQKIMHLEERYARKGPGNVMAEVDLKALAGPRAERLGELMQSGAVERLYRAWEQSKIQ